MRIIQLIHNIGSGGAERFVVNLANCLEEKGYEVEVCILLDGSIREYAFLKQFLNHGVTFHSFNFTPGFSFKKLLEVDSYIRSRQPDVVHCHLNVIPYIFPLAFRNRRIRFVHTIHNVAEKAIGIKIQYGLNSFFYRKHLILPVTISQRCQDSFKKLYHLDNVPAIDNGCTIVSPSVSYVQVGDEINKIKDGKDIPVFIHVARFAFQKNQDLLIDVFNKLAEERQDFVLLIIGDGFQKENAEELRKRACGKIHFCGEKANVGDYLLHSDAFCLTSFYEGLPLSLLEALSAGITPICTPVGGIPDVIKDGLTGYLSDGIDTSSYLAAIHRFLKCRIDPEMLKLHFKEHFSMNTCTEKYIKIYSNSSYE